MRPAPNGERDLVLARATARQGNAPGALELYTRFLAKNPRHASALLEAGGIALQLGDHDTATALLRRAVAAASKDARAHHQLGFALISLGRYSEAVASLSRATALEPRNPAHLAQIAMAYERLRRDDMARKMAEAAIALDPRHALALTQLARLDLLSGDLEGAERRARAAVESGSDPALTGSALHTLGRIAEKRGDHAGAFEAHMRANRLRASSPAARRMAGEARALIDEAAWYTPEGFEATLRRWAGLRYDDGLPAPILIVGFPRSGTTLTEQVLNAHPEVVTGDERPHVVAVRRRMHEMFADPGSPLLASMDALTDEQVLELRALYRREFLAGLPAGADRKVCVDKHPLRILQSPLIARLFPEARLVVLIRDPRDACLSGMFQDFALNPGMSLFLTMEGTAALYGASMGLWLRVRGVIGTPWMELRYEEFVSDFEAQARRLVEFVGLGWDDRVLSFQDVARKRAIITPSARAVSQPVGTGAIGKWRRYEQELGPLLEALGPYVEAFGYDA